MSRKLKIDLITGARPNFMKVAPLYLALTKRAWCEPRIIHTGQHYSDKLWKVFLNEFGIDEPHANLNAIPPGTSLGRLEQVELIREAYLAYCSKERPDFIVVVGDVNSTLAAARAGVNLGIPVGHVEAGLRSNDLSMPEELNRLETDALSSYLWTPSPDGDENLLAEKVRGKVELVGNVMIDAYCTLQDRINEAASELEGKRYGMVTFHRPENVDIKEQLSRLVDAVEAIASKIPLIFPIHPRTRDRMAAFGLLARVEKIPNLKLVEPLGYIPFMAHVSRARFIVTDSGGVQEETTYLKIPCITVRKNTERPITVTEGSNELILPERMPAGLLETVGAILEGSWNRKPRVPNLWDGRAAHRIADSIGRHFSV